MFRVPTVLRRVPTAVPPTAVGADFGGWNYSITRDIYALRRNPRTPHITLSARIAMEHVVMAR